MSDYKSLYDEISFCLNIYTCLVHDRGSSFGKTILAGNGYTMFIDSNKTLWALGKNTHEQLGTGKTSTYEIGPINTGWRNIDQIGEFTSSYSSYSFPFFYSKALDQIGDWTKKINLFTNCTCLHFSP